MARSKSYVIYARHGDAKLQRQVRSTATAHDLTVSQFVEAVMKYFHGLSPEAQKRALARAQSQGS